MRNDSELLTEDRSETNMDRALDISEYSSEGIRERTSLGSITHAFPPVSGVGTRERAKLLSEPITGLDYVSESTTSGILFVESWARTERLVDPTKGFNTISESIASGIFFGNSWLNLFEIEERIRSEFRQPPETHWVQNLRHPSYHLRHPIPILIERADDTVTATYNDIELCGTGASVKAATLDLCTKVVARYEELRESAAQSQEYTFLKQIIEEVEPPAWQELKQFYREKLEEIPYVQEGYINIDGNNAEVIIVLSEESVEIIEQLAEIDLEINLQFRPFYFLVEYESSEDYLELDDFERFY